MSVDVPFSELSKPVSRDGAIVPMVIENSPPEFARSFRKLADQIESGRVQINRLEVTKAGKGGPYWLVTMSLSDFGEKRG